MNREILVALMGSVLALLAGYALLQWTSESPRPSADGSLSDAAQDPRLSSPAPIPGSGPSVAGSTEDSAFTGGGDAALAAAENEWARAAADHQRTERALAESERALNEVEREVEAVEDFILDLEERGEDPADFAEEGMAKLGPAIDRFEARLDRVERDEQLEAEARIRLDAAKAKLENEKLNAL